MASNGADAMVTEQQIGIDEDEAALYDRQIRLWGVEAQNKMRTSSVLIITLRGLSTEVCKNIVLAGIGNLTILDDRDVSEEDLGAGFFFRDEDVRKKRAEVAIPRIQTLNPRVSINSSTISISQALDPSSNFLEPFDLVCLTEADPEMIKRVNKACRLSHKKMYASSCWGLSGFIFADLLTHEFIRTKEETSSLTKERKKITSKHTQTFVSFEAAWEGQKWKQGLKVREVRKIRMALGALVIWEYQRRHEGRLPDGSSESLLELKEIRKEELPKRQIPTSIDPDIALPETFLESLARTSAFEISPSCAVLGGILAQDILNVLGGKEVPIMNFFAFDGESCSGEIYPFNIDRVASS